MCGAHDRSPGGGGAGLGGQLVRALCSRRVGARGGGSESGDRELNQALERRGDSGTRVRTYGMRVIDYFPYLKLGIAYYLAGEPEAALRAFETAERLGAVKASERASSELELYRQQATDAVERQQTEQQRAVDDLIDLNLAEARDLRGAGRLEEALAAVDRALALAPENPDATGLSGALREELIRRENERIRRERVSELISEGQRLRADGRLTEAAGRFRQAVELAPDSTAAELLAEVQTELAVESDVGPATILRVPWLKLMSSSPGVNSTTRWRWSKRSWPPRLETHEPSISKTTFWLESRMRTKLPRLIDYSEKLRQNSVMAIPRGPLHPPTSCSHEIVATPGRSR